MAVSAPNIGLERLEDQIGWYDRKSRYAQRMYKGLKISQISAAALLPFLAAFDKIPPWVAGGIGVLIVVLEGLQQLNRYHDLWSSYRSTCEALRHEKHFYLGKAGPYAAVATPDVLLVERVESMISQEHAKWTLVQKQTREDEQGDPKRANGQG